MSAMFPPRPHTLEAHHPAATVQRLEQPKVLITGDTMLCVTEPEAALHPITGRYSIETAGMQKDRCCVARHGRQTLPLM